MDDKLVKVETLKAGDEFRFEGEWLEILHVRPGLGNTYLLVDGREAGDPGRWFVGRVGSDRRARIQPPPVLKISR